MVQMGASPAGVCERSVDPETAPHRKIERLLDSLRCCDLDTHSHCKRVGTLCRLIGDALGMDSDDVDQVALGGEIHDLGKIEIPAEILNKPGKLTAEERKVIESHPEAGFRMLIDLDGNEAAKQAVLHHHEKFDGSGYPFGLKGEEIPLAARICSVADVWDALVSDRPYKKGWAPDEALSFIQLNSGKYFDPEVVAAFSSVVAPQIVRRLAA